MLALADFRRDPRSSNSLRGRRNFDFFCQVDNAQLRRFLAGQITRNFNTTTSIGDVVKTFGRESWTFYRKGLFFKKTQNFLSKFQRLATSGRHNSAMITNRRKFTTKWSLYGMSIFLFTAGINLKSFPWAVYAPYKKPTQIFGNVRCPILGKPRTPLCRLTDRHRRKSRPGLETVNK